MLNAQSKKIFDSDDDDYELPNLSERVKSISLSQNVVQPKVFSDSESDDEFLKFSEKIRNTPQSQTIFHKIETPQEEDSLPAKAAVVTPFKKFNFNKIETSDSESDEKEFLKSIARTTKSSLTKSHLHPKKTSGSESDDNRILKSVRSQKTPLMKFHLHHKGTTSDSGSDDNEFLEFLDKVRSIHSSQKNIHSAYEPKSDSEDDVFTKFSERIRKTCTPRSQNKIPVGRENHLLSPCFPEKQKLFSDPNIVKGSNNTELSSKDKPGFLTSIQLANIEEYNSLFPPELKTLNSFMRQRTRYTDQLYEFLNRKIFDFKLPKDMKLIWSDALLVTAGMTRCSRKEGIYSCTIELSSELLTSFDRLQDTLVHEMCHAAVWIISNEVDVKHGPLWQIWASRCNLILPTIKCPKRCHNYDGNYKFLYHCPTCNWRKGRFKQSRKYVAAVCKKCKTPIQIITTD